MSWLFHPNLSLTPWGREKYGRYFAYDIFEFTHFLKWNCPILSQSLPETIRKYVVSNKEVLVQIMRQAIIWTRDGLVYWHIFASHGLDESSIRPIIAWDIFKE